MYDGSRRPGTSISPGYPSNQQGAQYGNQSQGPPDNQCFSQMPPNRQGQVNHSGFSQQQVLGAIETHLLVQISALKNCSIYIELEI